MEPLHPDANWFFDPDDEEWVEFSPPADEEETEEVNFAVTRFNEDDFFQVTGSVEDPEGNPPPEDTSWINLCNDMHCFDAPVVSGTFTIWVLPGPYEVWVDVEPRTGLHPPLDNGFGIFVDEAYDLGVLHLRARGDRSARVSGRVFLAATGEGVPDIELEAWSEEGDWNETETISNGQYALNIFPGHWHVSPVLTEEQEEEYIVLPPHRQGNIGAHQTISNTNFSLQRRDATISGQLVDQDGNTISDAEAVVFAELCRPERPDCNIISEDDVQGGSFELHVLGGYTYTLGVWSQSEGYIPGPPVPVEDVEVGETRTGVEVLLLEAGTRIHGRLLNADDDTPVDNIEAFVHGSNDENWVEDHLWPEKDPYEYNLFVLTPDTDSTDWTLGLWIEPGSGYIPLSPTLDVVVEAGVTDVVQDFYVQEINSVISGTVNLPTRASGSDPGAYITVFAEGVGPSEGLYFEAETNDAGHFRMHVLPGEYMVSAYLSPELSADFFPPMPSLWKTLRDNPVQLQFRRKPTMGDGAVEISGGLSISNSRSLGRDMSIPVFGESDDGISLRTSGTLANGYNMLVFSDTTWHVWAAYEDPDNGVYYESQVEEVEVGSSDMSGVELVLEQYELPETECWFFDPTQFKRFSLPAQGNLPSPSVEIPAGTMPVSDTVQICATPQVALPDGQDLVGFAYELEAWDSSGNLITENFNQSVRLIFYFDLDAIPAGTDAEELEVLYYSTVYQDWFTLENPFLDPVDGFATGKINHFTSFGLKSLRGATAPTEPPEESNNTIYLPIINNNK